MFESIKRGGYSWVCTCTHGCMCTHSCILILSYYLLPQGSKIFIFKITIFYVKIQENTTKYHHLLSTGYIGLRKLDINSDSPTAKSKRCEIIFIKDHINHHTKTKCQTTYVQSQKKLRAVKLMTQHASKLQYHPMTQSAMPPE